MTGYVISADIYLWVMRFGLGVFILGWLFAIFANKKILLMKKNINETRIKNYGWSRWNEFIFRLSENSYFKIFAIKPETGEYLRLEKLIKKAGGLGGLVPEMFQVYRIGVSSLFLLIVLSLVFIGNFLNATRIGNAQIALILIVFVAAMLLYFIPEMVVKYYVKIRQTKIHQELYNIGPFTISMLNSQAYGTYEIIQTLAETTTLLRPYMQNCLNEYYRNPRQAIQNMADRVGDDHFQVICNGLKQVVEMNKQYTALFMQQHLDEINRLRALQKEAKIKKKPLIFVFLLVFPMVSIVAVWFYPWIIRALDVMNAIF